MMCFVFVLMIGMVCAVNDWGDINTQPVAEGGGGEEGVGVDVAPVVASDDDVSVYVGSDGKYTRDFYYAIGFGIVAVLIVVVLIYLFFRKPKNKWKK